MILAVTYEDGKVFQHFGHTQAFKFYTIEDNKIVSSKIVDTQGQGHGALADFLSKNLVTVLICGGIGAGAISALTAQNIKIYGGVTGSADFAVSSYLMGTLQYNPDVKCSHHDHENKNTDHDCGSHDCGSHGCH